MFFALLALAKALVAENASCQTTLTCKYWPCAEVSTETQRKAHGKKAKKNNNTRSGKSPTDGNNGNGLVLLLGLPDGHGRADRPHTTDPHHSTAQEEEDSGTTESGQRAVPAKPAGERTASHKVLCRVGCF